MTEKCLTFYTTRPKSPDTPEVNMDGSGHF